MHFSNLIKGCINMIPISKVAAVGILCICAFSAKADTFPNRPVRIIVGFPAGTGPDIVARLLGQKLSETWSTAVIIDNKPGAGGVIAATEAARAQPDGYTLMLGETGQIAIAPASYNRLPYDPQRDFTPISQVATNDFALLVNPEKIPVQDVKQFIAWSKQQPKGLFMGSFGAGTPGHFGTYMFGEAIGVPAEPVHYKSTGDAMSGIMSGDVAATFASMGLSVPNVKAKKLVAIGIASDRRNAALPDVPTFVEQGFAQLKFNSWYGLFAPARTPPQVVAKLEADVRRALQAPEVRAKIEAPGFTATGTSAAEFSKVIASDVGIWAKLVSATGFKAD